MRSDEEGSSLRLSLLSPSCGLLVSIDRKRERNITNLCVFLSSVYCILVTHGFSERKNQQPQSGSGAGLLKSRSGSCRAQGPLWVGIVWNFQQCQRWVTMRKMSMTSQQIIETGLPNLWLDHIAQFQHINEQQEVVWQRRFHHILMDVLVQIWGADWWLAGSYSAWSRNTSSSTEEQTCRRCWNAQRTSWPRISESRRWSQIFQGYVETPLHQRSSERVPLEFFQFSWARRANIEMVKWIGNFSLLLKRLRDACMDVLQVSAMSEERKQNQYLADVTHVHEERQRRNATALDPNSQGIRTRKKPEAIGTPHRWATMKGSFNSVIMCQHWCSLLQVIWVKPRERETHKFPFSPGTECYRLHSGSSEDSICWIVLHAEKLNKESFTPSERSRQQHEQNLYRRRLCWRRIWTMVHRWSNRRTRLHWRWEIVFLEIRRQRASLAVQKVSKVAKLKDGKGNGKGKGKEWIQKELVKQHSSAKNQHRILNGGRKKTVFGGPRDKKSRKGSSKGNEGFQKGGFRPYPPTKGCRQWFLPVQRQRQGPKRKGQGRWLSSISIFSLWNTQWRRIWPCLRIRWLVFQPSAWRVLNVKILHGWQQSP